MIIKSFTADTVSGALKLIREEMGGGAVILKTRPCNPAETALTGNRVEVTACVDEKALSPKSAARETKPAPTAMRLFTKEPEPEPAAIKIPRKRSETTSKQAELSNTKNVHDFAAKLEKKLDFILDSQYSPESSADFGTRITPIYLNLLDDDIPMEVASHLTKAVEQKVGPENDIEAVAYDVLVKELSSAISQEISIKQGMKVVFAGPSGAGKTSALAKLAAQLTTEEKMKVTLASLDNMKVAAYEEIGSYAEMLDLPLDLSGNFKKKSNKDSVLIIDTPSLPCDDSRGAELVKRIGTDWNRTLSSWSIQSAAALGT